MKKQNRPKMAVTKLNKPLSWEYKVTTTESLTQEVQNHDIAVSREASTAMKETVKMNLESSLCKLGESGWEFTAVIGEFVIFKRPKD